MRYEFYFFIPWLVIIPAGLFYLLRSNSRVNSGLCPKCGSRIEKEETDGLYTSDKTVIGVRCKKCKAENKKASLIKIILIMLFSTWALIGLILFRKISLVG